MHITEEYTELVKRTKVLETRCDKCNEQIKNESYTRHNFKLEYSWGSSYPSGGLGDTLTIEHLCHDCAIQLFDLLRSHGYRVLESEWDY